ncbi:MAG: phosphodiester glycosidase family protein, partial [Candidatus Gastranaerophilaceae bacterium]
LNGKQILDPHNNKNLMNNLHLKPYMDKILNRSELRILKAKSDGSLKYDIVPHNEVCSDDYEILHSIQGGPGLVPDLRLAEEFFVLTDKTGKIISESASSLSKYARTLVGIKDNNLYFVIATNKHPISLPEAAEILKEAGMEKAMAFDGGGSVSVDFKDDDLHIISDKDQTARRLKSFWIITSEQELKQN